ncbi:sugar phosphate isomerase/epimerase [Paenibacillus athensensis]|uniref:3-dehydroshikimate dehydratase n=1 Tax=Paenibacillus athensensis TaxID=1967502 RepID=A0A4Y8Q603_9BACL|nr:sugar phosphate isomerase/epimerase [Paenibacillus athensensis]MCD1258411.1 sugar phosphate isomerase/epimerase [Paenibacillus athensensis]
MNVSLCTVSFRHQLVSFAELIGFAQRHGFDGIELWGAHARQLQDGNREQNGEQLDILRQSGLVISMLSDYIDIGVRPLETVLEKTDRLLDCARTLDVAKLRIFAGGRPSVSVSADERALYIRGLRAVCERAEAAGAHILVETHPNTLADGLASTLRLLEEVDHEALAINLDFLHVWEAGDDPVAAYHELEHKVRHFHLKNIATAAQLDVFQPHNVFSASGSREGMVRLADGALDYRAVLAAAGSSRHFASLEWFGADPFRVLADEIGWLRKTLSATAAAAGAGPLPAPAGTL